MKKQNKPQPGVLPKITIAGTVRLKTTRSPRKKKAEKPSGA